MAMAAMRNRADTLAFVTISCTENDVALRKT